MYCFSEEKFSIAPTAMLHAFDADNLYVRHSNPFSGMPWKALQHACKEPTTKDFFFNISTLI
jgi:hypothetical protein